MNDDTAALDAPQALTPASPWTAPAWSADELAERINGLYAATWQIMRQSEAQLMEMLWELRHKHFTEEDIAPDWKTRSPEQRFQAFVEARIPWLPPADAQRMVDTWDAARKDRGLREFARAKPGEAMRFFPLLAAGGADALPGDEDVAEILAMPPRKRNKKLRELIDAADGGGKRHPDDEELIKSLRAERDELAAAKRAGQDSDACHAALEKYLDDINQLAADLRVQASVDTTDFLAVFGPGLKKQSIFQARLNSIRAIASSLEADAAHLLEQWLNFAGAAPDADD